MHFPRISIVTPSFNQAHYIEETIDSILSQNYPNLEYIIIDGGSRDGSVDIIKRYERYLKYWISQPDKGQADAINKGLTFCTGEIFNWINSDDILLSGALDHIAEMYTRERFDLLAGHVVNFNNSGYKEAVANNNLSPINTLFREIGYFHQPGIWLKTERVKALNGVKTDYHYSFDAHLIIRYMMDNVKMVYTDKELVKFRLHDNSKTMSYHTRFVEENIRIADELKESDYFKADKEKIKSWIRFKKWYLLLYNIEKSDSGRSVKIYKILFSIISDIPFRFSRYTAGTIRNILFNRPGNQIY
ncbi:MAG: glycosyltransferase family 2 protein [Cytophagaceae bacterium]